MTNTLNLAFIGGGINSAVGRAHFISAQMDKNFQVVSGFFSRDKKINLLTGKTWNIDKSRIYDDLDTFIENEQNRIDVVALLSPTTDHYSVLKKLVKNKIPIICEKSFTRNEAEAREICKLSKKYNSYISLVYNYTGYPMIRELRQLIRSGSFGKIINVIIDMPQEGYISVDQKNKAFRPQQWRLKDYGIPIISLDLGIHLFHMLRFLIKDKPDSVISVENSYGNFKNLIDDVRCLIKLENKATASLWYSKSALGSRNGLSVNIYGTKLSAKWHQSQPEKLELNYKNGEKTKIDRASHLTKHASKDRYSRFKVGHPAGFIEAFANMYWDIADDLKYFKRNGIKKNSEFVFYEDHGLEGLNFLKKISISSKKNNWVKIKN